MTPELGRETIVHIHRFMDSLAKVRHTRQSSIEVLPNDGKNPVSDKDPIFFAGNAWLTGGTGPGKLVRQASMPVNGQDSSGDSPVSVVPDRTVDRNGLRRD